MIKIKSEVVVVELDYHGVRVVLNDEHMKFDEAREFLVNAILLYANRKGLDVRFIFFNVRGTENSGVNILFGRNNAE